MRRCLLVFSCLLLTAVPALAEVRIARHNRVPNRKPGYCAWTSLESLARHHKIKKLYGLTDLRQEDAETWNWRWNGSDWVPYQKLTNGGSIASIRKQLKELKVHYRSWSEGTYDWSVLEDAIKRDRGAVIAVHEYPKPGSYHAVVLTDLTSAKLRFIDTNDIDNVYEVDRDWLEYSWDGGAVILED